MFFISCRNDGTVRRVTGPGRTEIFADGLGIATGIAFNPGGDPLRRRPGGGIYAVESRGSVRRFAKLPPSVAAYHLAFGPDDHLYVTAPTLSNDDPIFRISLGGAVSVAWSTWRGRRGWPSTPRRDALPCGRHPRRRARDLPHRQDGSASLAVTGENLVGLAFDPRGRMVIASTNTIYRLGWTGS